MLSKPAMENSWKLSTGIGEGLKFRKISGAPSQYPVGRKSYCRAPWVQPQSKIVATSLLLSSVSISSINQSIKMSIYIAPAQRSSPRQLLQQNTHAQKPCLETSLELRMSARI